MENLFLRVLTLSLTRRWCCCPCWRWPPAAPPLRRAYLLCAVAGAGRPAGAALQPILPEPAVTVELPPSQAVTVPAVVRPRRRRRCPMFPNLPGPRNPRPLRRRRCAPSPGRSWGPGCGWAAWRPCWSIRGWATPWPGGSCSGARSPVQRRRPPFWRIWRPS